MSDTLELLEELVALDTTSRTSNRTLLALVRGHLEAAGATVEQRDLPGSDSASLVARVGPAVEGGVALVAHADCVPVTDQDWRRDPFTMAVDGDRVYGRGTTDMKGFLAAVLAALPRATAAGLARPLLLVVTADEEVGTVGAPDAVRLLSDTQPPPAAVVVGEPTSLRPVNAHKGVRVQRTEVTGRGGHSSQPHLAANALVAAARIATFIEDLGDRQRRTVADDRFDPPHTTVNVATLRAGSAVNIVPASATLTWEYRPVPADDSDALVQEVERYADEEVLPRLRASTGDGTIVTHRDAVARGLAPEPGGAAEALVRRLTGHDGPAGTVPFGTDGGHFQAAGYSTVVCGPGAIEQAHQPDEWIARSELAACERFLDRLIADLATR